MSRLTLVGEPLGHLMLKATHNGAGTGTVYLCEATGEPITSERIQIGASKDREQFIANHVPVELRELARPALIRLSAKADAARVELAGEPQGAASEKSELMPFRETAPADEPQDGGRLLNDIRTCIRRYVWLKPDLVDFLGLYVLHTHALDAADHTPYPHIHSSDKRCGKSTLLDVLVGLTPRGVRVSVVSTSFLFRLMDEYTVSLAIDEIGAWLNGPHTGELRAVLNDGFQRDGKVGRTESVSKGKNTEFRPTFFRVWGAKMIAGISRTLPDDTLDRTVPIRLERANAAERKSLQKLRRRAYQVQADVLRSRAARWALDHADSLRSATVIFPDGLSGRQEDIWEPILAVAQEIGREIAEAARATAQRLSDTRAPSLGEQLLGDLLRCFTSGERPLAFVPTSEILEFLREECDERWGRLPDTKKEITAERLAALLREYGVKSARPQKERGYQADDLRQPWSQYLEDDASRDRLARFQYLPEPGKPGNLAKAEPPTGNPSLPGLGDPYDVAERAGMADL